jgi:uncharacterized SAM-binding protein YcdF (DUF218 family)
VFFFLSKTIGMIMLPSNFLIGLSVVGVLLLATRFARLARGLMIASITLLAICGFSPLANWLLYPLESRFPPPDLARGAPDGIIVLGGSIDPELSAALDRPIIRNWAERITAAAELARQYPNARIVFSGGSGNLISSGAKEADYAAIVFESLGIPKTRLTMERLSRNTQENAEFSKALVAPKPGERWLLITSAFHMPRSVGLFRRAGFEVEPYPVDWRVGGRAGLYSFFPVAGEGLGLADLAFREWMGLMAYRITGKIDELLPGPRKN